MSNMDPESAGNDESLEKKGATAPGDHGGKAGKPAEETDDGTVLESTMTSPPGAGDLVGGSAVAVSDDESPTVVRSSVPESQPQSPRGTSPSDGLADESAAESAAESLAFWRRIHGGAGPETVVDVGQSENESGASDASFAVPGKIGNYFVDEQIGSGGFSVVYAARHVNAPNTVVALKVFRQLKLDSWQRLHVETLVLSKFDHPNLVSVLDAGELSDGTPFLVMNRVDGLPLNRYLKQQALSDVELAKLFRGIALAIKHAHSRDVVHRDLKPTNIMVRANGDPVVIDFGLAKRLEVSRIEQSLTATRAVVGTLGFLAPEQAGPRKQEITRAVDVYGLGATLYHALTGQPPLNRSDWWVALTELRDKVPTPPREYRPDVSPDLELICMKCLEKRPEDRYASMEALADDLARFIAGRRVMVRPMGWLRRQIRWSQANPIVAGLATLLFIAITMGLISTIALWRQADFRWRQSADALKQAEDILRTNVNAAETMLVQTPGALEYRQQQLETALEFRQQLNALVENDQANHRAVAVLHFLLAKNNGRLGRFTESRRHYEEALTRFRLMLTAKPGDRQLRFDVFHSLLGLDSTSVTEADLASRGASEVVELPSEVRRLTWLSEAQAIIEGLVAEFPEEGSLRDALACNLLLMSHRLRTDDPERALMLGEACYREAVVLKEQLSEPCLEWRHVGTAANAIATIHMENGRLDEANRWMDIAEAATREFLARPDFDPGEIIDLTEVLLNRRSLAIMNRDLQTADIYEKQWRDLISKSAEDYPDYFVFGEHLRSADRLMEERSQLPGQ